MSTTGKLTVRKCSHIDIRSHDGIRRCQPAWRAYIDGEPHPSLYVRAKNRGDHALGYVPTCGISGLALEAPDEDRAAPEKDTPHAAAKRGLAAIDAYPGYEQAAERKRIPGYAPVVAIIDPGSITDDMDAAKWRWVKEPTVHSDIYEGVAEMERS